jgi:hypothetical protein
MECPICAALNRERSRECEAEAAATIRQRSQSLLKPLGEMAGRDSLAPVVHASRKRQAHIAFKLSQHQAQDHPEAAKNRAAVA